MHTWAMTCATKTPRCSCRWRTSQVYIYIYITSQVYIYIYYFCTSQVYIYIYYFFFDGPVWRYAYSYIHIHLSIVWGASCENSSWYPKLKYSICSVEHAFFERFECKMVVGPSQLRRPLFIPCISGAAGWRPTLNALSEYVYIHLYIYVYIYIYIYI